VCARLHACPAAHPSLQLPGHEKDLSAATFCLKDEDHTLGNALRYMLMKK
jgi:DNA-directed RNA polymerase subunit L